MKEIEYLDELSYKDMTIDDIINYCVENGHTAWLKKAIAPIETKVYPRVRVARVDENGNVLRNAKGKILYTSRVDKTQEPKIEKKEPTFMQIKEAFVLKFMPEIKPVKKAKALTMYDRIKAL